VSVPKTGQKTDGMYGIRSNHLLDIEVDGLSATKR
jgi:hypothetical protein